MAVDILQRKVDKMSIRVDANGVGVLDRKSLPLHSQNPPSSDFADSGCRANRKTRAESPAMLGQTSPCDKQQWHRAAIPPGY
jgi:hypothetical protein